MKKNPAAKAGTARVTAKDTVSWRGSTYKVATGALPAGVDVPVLLQGQRLDIPEQVGGSTSGITEAEADARYVNVDGDTMTGTLAFESGSPKGDPDLRASGDANGASLDVWVPEPDGGPDVFPVIRMSRYMYGGSPQGQVYLFVPLHLSQGIVSGPYGGGTTFTVDNAGNVAAVGVVAAPRFALPEAPSPGGRRWMIGATETNAPWVLYRYDDTGTYAGTAVNINRSTGAATFESLRTGKPASNESAAVLNRGENDARYMLKTDLKAAAAAATSFADFQARVAAL